MNTITHRATNAKPCPVCDSGSKGCSATADGLHFCRGIQAGHPTPHGWRELPGSPDDTGFRHFRRVDALPSRPKRGKAPPKPSRDWRSDAERYAKALSAEAKARLAASLGLPDDAIDAVTWIGHDGDAFTFSEVDLDGRIIGISRRFFDGSKLMLKGSKRGLTVPHGWRESVGPIFIVEGASDVLAMTAAGLTAIGRPSNVGGAELLAELLRSVNREIIVIGENDAKSDGLWPGRDGAESVSRKLAEAWGRPVTVAYPPDEAKDVRGWLTDESRASMPWHERGAMLQTAILDSARMVEPSEESKSEPDKVRPSAADLLIAIGQTAELFHDGAGEAFVTFNRQTVAVDSSRFRKWLTAEYYAQTGKGPNGEAMTTAVRTIEATAIHDGPEAEVNVRVKTRDGAIYLSLADDAGAVIRIDANGWEHDPNPPAKFLTTKNATALPMPERGGRIEDLRRFVNCPGDDEFALLCGWVSACFQPDRPMPILILTGGQGSAKSTTGRILKSLIDPERVKDRSSPKDEHDLSIWASNSFLLAVDNVSRFDGWLSDSFCRLATGAGFGTRTKYTTADETIFEAKRPTVLNGIEDFATRADLLERSIILHHPPIPDNRRQLDADLWDAFERAKPRLLGAIFDRISAGLRTLPSVKIDNLPRMADAARFAIACERGMNEPSRFEEAYRSNQVEGMESTLLDSPIVEPLMMLIDRSDGIWEGSPAVLFETLTPSPSNRTPTRWPRSASRLSGSLRRLAPALAKCLGVTVSDYRTSDRKRTRIIRIEREKFCEVPSESSDTSARTTLADASDGTDAILQNFSGHDLSALKH
jgi:hypothetical protein